MPNLPDKYKDLVRNQNLVGWDQLLLGRFVSEWSELAQEFITSLPKEQRTKSQSGNQWVIQITDIILNFAHSVWKERNADRHGRDNKEQERILVQRIVRQTNELYELRHDVLPLHKKLYYRNLTEHENQEPTSRGLQQWITTWGPVLRDSFESAKRLGIQQMQTITEYFITQNSEITQYESD